MLSVTLRAQTCSYVENSDGSRDFRCPDGRYLGLTRAQVDANQIALNNGGAAIREVEKLTAIIAEKDKQIVIAEELRKTEAEKAVLQKQIADSLRGDLDRSRENTTRFQNLFMEERDLRKEASSFIPHGNKTKFDKFLSLFDSKAVQFTIRGLIPIWTATRCQ